jgi:cobalt-zinc-cadmium efflux system membrane fusion protein
MFPRYVMTRPINRLMFAAVIAAALTLAGCGERSPQAPVATQSGATKAGSGSAGTGAAAPGARRATDPMEVSVRPEMASYFKVGKVDQVEIAQTLDAVGRIEADARRVARIGAAVSGRVTEILAEVGDPVQRGQPLAEIASPELTNAQLNYLRS